MKNKRLCFALLHKVKLVFYRIYRIKNIKNQKFVSQMCGAGGGGWGAVCRGRGWPGPVLAKGRDTGAPAWEALSSPGQPVLVITEE